MWGASLAVLPALAVFFFLLAVWLRVPTMSSYYEEMPIVTAMLLGPWVSYILWTTVVAAGLDRAHAVGDAERTREARHYCVWFALLSFLGYPVLSFLGQRLFLIAAPLVYTLFPTAVFFFLSPGQRHHRVLDFGAIALAVGAAVAWIAWELLSLSNDPTAWDSLFWITTICALAAFGANLMSMVTPRTSDMSRLVATPGRG